MTRRRRRFSEVPVPALIESLDPEGRGVARVDGQLVLVHGGLPGERVTVRFQRRRAGFDEAVVVEVLEPAADRVQPRCAHFGVCGGCSLQHLAPSAQLSFKEQRLLRTLATEGGLEPEEFLPPLCGEIWGYRRKARLGARYVVKKGRVLVGFREKGSGFVADLAGCDILHPAVGTRIGSLKRMVGALAACRQIPQIEVASGDGTVALVFRHLVPLSNEDCTVLAAFGASHEYHIYLQSGGPDTVTCLHPQKREAYLDYRLDEWNVVLRFRPTDFAQVNSEMNRRLVARAMQLLEIGPQDHVCDLFCGVGNFTLPLARLASRVLGVEADAGLVERARENARLNCIGNADFLVQDLSTAAAAIWREADCHKVLLDPPRSGAREVVASMGAPYPSRLVYVSCHAPTFARDAGELVHRHGYRLVSAGIVDMFPHTSHAESIALFQR